MSDRPPHFYVTLSGTRGFPKREFDNIMISAGGMWSSKRGKFIRRRPPAHTSFFLDSGGFNALHRYGDYPWELADHLSLIKHYRPHLAATMDYPCEPEINRATGTLTNRQRIERTVENSLWLFDRCPPGDTLIVPVIQGYALEEYRYCVGLYRDSGLLDRTDYFAIGTMCRRTSIKELVKLTVGVTDAVWTTHPHVRFHFFGLKLSALREKAIHDRAYSVDSAAWSLNPEHGSLYLKDPIGGGALDSYLERVDAVKVDQGRQQTISPCR